MSPTGEAEGAALTPRERQIIRLVSEGLSNKQIARRLNVTDGTIKVHLHHIFEKLRVDNRTALAAIYLSPPAISFAQRKTPTTNDLNCDRRHQTEEN